MKIVLISNLYPPYAVGGAELIAQRMAYGLRDQGHEVIVLTTRPFSSWNAFRLHKSLEEGISVYRFFPLNFYHYLNGSRMFFLLRIAWLCINIIQVHSAIITRFIIRKESPDLVITHNLMGIGMNLPRVIASMRIPHIHVAHDVQLVNPSGIIECGQERSFWQTCIHVIGYPALMRFYFSHVNAIISPSQFLMDFYVRQGFFKSAHRYILPNPVKQIDALGSHSCQSPVSLLYLGQVTRAKGILDLIWAIKELPPNKAVLHIVGIGTESANVRRLCQNDSRFVIHGYIPHDELLNMFHNVDLLIIPSRCYDNSPTVLFEALSAGIPALVSDCGGAKEIIREGENGWVYSSGSRSALLSKLSELVADTKMIDHAAESAQQSIAPYVEEHYFRRLQSIISSEIT